MRLREAIDTLGRRLGETYAWELYGLRIRQEGIGETEVHSGAMLCPLATAVSELPRATLERVLGDGRFSEFRKAVETERAAVADQLAGEEGAEGPPTAEDTTRMAAAVVVEDNPRQSATAALLSLDEATIDAIARSADEVDTPKGRRLVRALASANNTLRAEFTAAFGDERMRREPRR